MSNVNWVFAQWVTNSLKEEKLGSPKPPGLWPSEASMAVDGEAYTRVLGKCRRATMFRYILDAVTYEPEIKSNWHELVEVIRSKKPSLSPKTLWTFKNGSLFEELIVEQAKLSRVFVAREVPVFFSKHGVLGRIDLIVENPVTGKRRCVECKSVYGYGSDETIGKYLANGFRFGTPKDSHLMQLGLYDFGYAKQNGFEASELLYGDRGSGFLGAYAVMVDDEGFIHYKQTHPELGPAVKTKINLNQVLIEYEKTKTNLQNHIIPERDFDLVYSTERIQAMFEANELSKADKERHEKWVAYTTGQGGRKIGPVEKGDWECNYCDYKKVCYDENSKPNVLPRVGPVECTPAS